MLSSRRTWTCPLRTWQSVSPLRHTWVHVSQFPVPLKGKIPPTSPLSSSSPFSAPFSLLFLTPFPLSQQHPPLTFCLLCTAYLSLTHHWDSRLLPSTFPLARTHYSVCLYVCVCNTCVQWLWKPEEGVGCSGTRVTDDCESLYGCWELNPIPFQDLNRL